MMHFFSSATSPGLTLAGLLLLAAPAAQAQAPAWQTALAVGNATSQVLATAADAAGNVYVTGSFTGTLSVPGTTLTSVGGTDGFVAKYNAQAGTFWAMRFGGTGADKGTALAVAGSGLYVAATFEETASFGPLALTSAGASDVAVLKLTDQGASPAVVWAQGGGGIGIDEAWALALSGTSVYLGGVVGDAASFGPVTLPVVVNTDGFVAKLTDAGTSAAFGWARTLGGTSYDAVYALAASGPAVYAGGFFLSTATFGATTLTSAGNADALVVKLTDNGPTSTVAWARQGGGTNSDQVNALYSTGSTVYATGAFSSTAAFGGVSLTAAGQADVFVAKLADAGPTASYVWALPAGSSASDYGYGLAVSGSSVFVAGGAGAGATFGATTIPGVGGYDAFVTRLDDAGPSARFAWVQTAGGTGTDVASSVAVANDHVYVGGYARLPATFGTLALYGGIAPNTGFLAGLVPGALATAPAAPGLAFTVAPNPAHGTATVRLPAGLGAAPATLTVLDALGRAVRIQTAAANAPVVLDLADLAPGLYAVRVMANGATGTARLVLE